MKNKNENKTNQPSEIQEDNILGFIFSYQGFYVEKIKNLFHVFCPGVTHAICDSAYKEKDLAINRCKYLSKYLSKYDS